MKDGVRQLPLEKLGQGSIKPLSSVIRDIKYKARLARLWGLQWLTK